MTQRRFNAIAALIVIAFFLTVGTFFVRGWMDCNARGGSYVKNFVGWPVCIQTAKP